MTIQLRFRFLAISRRRSVLGSMDTPNLLTCYSRTNLFRFSFKNRIAGEWNRLPRDIRRASSAANFKLKVFLDFKLVFKFLLYTYIGFRSFGVSLVWRCSA